jgi:hypothetical protein
LNDLRDQKNDARRGAQGWWSPGGRGAAVRENRQVGALIDVLSGCRFRKVSTSLRFEDKKRGRVNPVEPFYPKFLRFSPVDRGL